MEKSKLRRQIELGIISLVEVEEVGQITKAEKILEGSGSRWQYLRRGVNWFE